ncbi:MAG: GxxExxY protein [Anaerolineaceae bacterium]|nr:GxxExxY protein [Anaerolineaceae bacterium]
MARRDPLTYDVIGAAMEVHKRLGHGFLEAVYQEALAIELTHRHVPFRREVDLPIMYREQVLKSIYRVDFICYDTILVELKAMKKLGSSEVAQTLNYLKAGNFAKGLLINFGATSLEYKRFIGTPKNKSATDSSN